MFLETKTQICSNGQNGGLITKDLFFLGFIFLWLYVDAASSEPTSSLFFTWNIHHREQGCMRYNSVPADVTIWTEPLSSKKEKNEQKKDFNWLKLSYFV